MKAALALVPAVCLAFVPYEIDSDWHLDAPHGAGRWVSSFVWGDKLVVGQKLSAATPLRADVGYAQPFLIFDKDTGAFVQSFGSDMVMNVSVTTEFGAESCYGPYWSMEKLQLMPREHVQASCKRSSLCESQDLMWLADYDAHTISVIGLEDLQLKRVLGRHGDDAQPDDGLVHPAVMASQLAIDAEKFGNPAGVAFADGRAFVADGEDYKEQINRLEAWSLDQSTGLPRDDSAQSVDWILPQKPPSQRSVKEQIFRTPHSIVFHEPSGKLLVGDRGKKAEYYKEDGPGWGNVGPNWEHTEGHGRILVVDPKTEEVSEFQCPDLELGAHKPPLAVDTFQGERDMLFITVGGYNQTEQGWSDEQAIYIVDVVERDGGLGCTEILQHMPVDIETCDVMHDLKVDKETGDAYVSCPGCKGERVMRIRPQAGQVLV